MPPITPDESSSIKTYLVQIARVPMYFNQIQRVLRIEFGIDDSRRYFDFLLTDTTHVPNNGTTLALLQTYESILTSNRYAMAEDDPRLDLTPGYSEDGVFDPRQIPYGYISDIVSRRATIFSSNNPDGDTALQMRDMDDPSNWENIQISLHGHLPDSYTKTTEEMNGDPSFSSYGVTIGNNFTQVTGPGANGITMGPDSNMVFTGDIHYQKSKGSKGMMSDNPLAGWMPPTIMTVAPAIDWIPNINAIAGFGTLAQRVAKGIDLGAGLADLVSNLV